MRDSVPNLIVGLAVVLCCALPMLILAGAFAASGGLLFNQQLWLGVGVGLIVVTIIGVLSRLFLRRSE